MASIVSDPDLQTLTRASIAAAERWEDDALLPALHRATRAAPTQARAWHLLGLAHRNLDELAPSVEALATAAEIAPHDEKIVHALARSTLEAGGDAVELFERAHTLAPLDAPIMKGLAAAWVARGEASVAVAFLDRVLSEHPLWTDGHGVVARLRWSLGDRANFTESFDRALTLRPKDGPLWLEYCLLLLRAEQFEQAERVTARARVNVGDSRLLNLVDAAAASEAGRFREAEQRFAKLGPIAESGWDLYHIRYLLRAGRPKLAATIAQDVIAKGEGENLWPLLSLAWRMLDDPQAEWLDGDPRLVSIHDLSRDVGPRTQVADVLRQLHSSAAQPVDQSLRGGTQTDGPLFSRTDPVIARVRAAVLGAVRKHVDQLPPPDPRHPTLRHDRRRLRFAGSWSVRLTGGGRHVSHVHPAGWISSALYVALPDGRDVGPVRGGWLTVGNADDVGVLLPALREIEPVHGRLVLFPSTMWHGTRPFSAGERLTIAFDIARPPR